MPAVFAIWHNQQLIAAFGTARRCALLPRLFESIDALVQAVDSYYEGYRRVFGRRWRGRKEKPEKAADRRHADNHNQVSRSLPLFPEPFRTLSTDFV
jgi:hypothetical protein